MVPKLCPALTIIIILGGCFDRNLALLAADRDAER
jgi:hypothetical protein